MIYLAYYNQTSVFSNIINSLTFQNANYNLITPKNTLKIYQDFDNIIFSSDISPNSEYLTKYFSDGFYYFFIDEIKNIAPKTELDNTLLNILNPFINSRTIIAVFQRYYPQQIYRLCI